MIVWWSYTIILDRCKRCMKCLASCPSEAIIVLESGPLQIEEKSCIRCGQCLPECKFRAISKAFKPKILKINERPSF